MYRELQEQYGESLEILPFNYKNSKMDVAVRCPIHGDMVRRYDRLKAGKGCPQCGLDGAAKSRRFNLEEILERIPPEYEVKHLAGDSLNTSILEVICPRHGIQPPRLAKAVTGSPCPQCGFGRIGAALSAGYDEFVTMARATHGDRYDYSKVVYVRKTDPVAIICPEHGQFMQRPENHWRKGQGCPSCANYTLNPAKPCELYVYHITPAHGTPYLGYGVTGDPATRHGKHKTQFRRACVTAEKILSKMFLRGVDGLNCEREIRQTLPAINSKILTFHTENTSTDNLSKLMAIVAKHLP